MNRGCLQGSSLIIISVFLVGCAQNFSRQEVGAATGAVVGGVAGQLFGKGSGRVAMAIGGAVLGGLIGSKIGQSMDQQDKIKLNQSLEKVKAGQVTRWRNPDTGNSYSVEPVRTYQRYNKQERRQQYCREFQQKAMIAGQKQEIYGTACRQPDGRWQVISTEK
ncbi:Surface antigen [Piscirickettsia salmonis]|uniref:17 kDa antigen n=1 Tax=Piscirickettsia salmonis TaxID=1238 RepID=Q9F9K8_PISSA|nr:RT0821/Lpp0805 family surface protein [Piscirickettsia salmonis]AAG17000.1 17 kDa antigen [Piscirickettsia salmonis]ALB23163.1 OspA [Piscirickettsia salmonis]KLV34261.1 surface antigen [Piscirickettsia salmonis]KLV34540.1 surface antigen [Piscirickettsia salmonis]QGN98234.1 Surface antigen [Piscirickettsia salmonis]